MRAYESCARPNYSFVAHVASRVATSNSRIAIGRSLQETSVDARRSTGIQLIGIQFQMGRWFLAMQPRARSQPRPRRRMTMGASTANSSRRMFRANVQIDEAKVPGKGIVTPGENGCPDYATGNIDAGWMDYNTSTDDVGNEGSHPRPNSSHRKVVRFAPSRSTLPIPSRGAWDSGRFGEPVDGAGVIQILTSGRRRRCRRQRPSCAIRRCSAGATS